MNAVRSGAAWIYRVLITVFAAAVVVQLFLAGLGLFRALPGEREVASHQTFEDEFESHAALGWSLFLGALLLLIVILIAWTGPRSIGATFALAALAFVEMLLPEATDWVAAFHVLNGVLILAVSLFLTWRAWRGNLLIPPPRLRGPAPAA